MFTVDEDFGEDTVTPNAAPSRHSEIRAAGGGLRAEAAAAALIVSSLPVLAFQRSSQSDLERKGEVLPKKGGSLYEHMLSLDQPGVPACWGLGALQMMQMADRGAGQGCPQPLSGVKQCGCNS